MAAKSNIWYRLGYAWENVRLGPALASSHEQPADRRSSAPSARSGNGSDLDTARKLDGALPWRMLLDEAGGLGLRALEKQGRRTPARGDYPQAALAGAGAALVARGCRTLLGNDAAATDDPGLGQELLAGAGQGLAHAVLARYLPGGALLHFAFHSAAGYGAARRGGLLQVVRPLAPAGVRALARVSPKSDGQRGILEHAAFAAAFLLLYRQGTAAKD